MGQGLVSLGAVGVGLVFVLVSSRQIISEILSSGNPPCPLSSSVVWHNLSSKNGLAPTSEPVWGAGDWELPLGQRPGRSESAHVSVSRWDGTVAPWARALRGMEFALELRAHTEQ